MTKFLTPDDIAHAAVFRTTTRRIAAEVTGLTGIPEAEIYGRSRMPEVCRARELVCYIARRNGMSYSRIGRALGRDRSTIRAAVANERIRRGEI